MRLVLAAIVLLASGCSLVFSGDKHAARDAGDSADTAVPEDAGPEACDRDGDGAESPACGGSDCDDANPIVFPGNESAPRLLWPLNGAYTGSLHAAATAMTLRPELRWLRAGGGCSPSYEIEIDDSCTTPGFSGCTFPSPEVQATAAGTSHRPAADLAVSTSQPVGRRYYWRARACEASVCSDWSAVRYLELGRVPSDVNGDGYSDLLVTARDQDSPEVDEGNAFVFYGRSAGLAATPSVPLDNPTDQAGGAFGTPASFGDLNGDGFADFVVGAPKQDAGATDEGNVFVYYGQASGISTTPSLPLDNPDNDGGGGFGSSLATAGDLDGDGYADLVVGAPGQDAGAGGEGMVFVYRGGGAGLVTTPSPVGSPARQMGAAFGSAVSSGGDLDGDGYADLVVGAPMQDAGATDEGGVFVLYGGSGGAGAGRTAIIDSPRNTPNNFGNDVSSAGDLDGDGYSDLVTAAWAECIAYIFYGSPSGVPTARDLMISGPPNPAGPEGCGFLGNAVASEGDLNGDSFADVVLGSFRQSNPELAEGNVFVHDGSASRISSTPSLTVDMPTAAAYSHFGDGVTVAGDFDGNGFADLVVGASILFGAAFQTGAAFVYYGGAAGVPASPAITLHNPAGQDSGHFGIVRAK
jgi:FG-GAP repeat protein